MKKSLTFAIGVLLPAILLLCPSVSDAQQNSPPRRDGNTTRGNMNPNLRSGQGNQRPGQGNQRPGQADQLGARAGGAMDVPKNEQAIGASGIAWYTTWDTGLAEAKRSNRPILFMSAATVCSGVSGVF